MSRYSILGIPERPFSYVKKTNSIWRGLRGFTAARILVKDQLTPSGSPVLSLTFLARTVKLVELGFGMEREMRPSVYFLDSAEVVINLVGKTTVRDVIVA